jgi:serine/threonine-protein kinase
LLFRLDNSGAYEDLWAIRPGVDSIDRPLFVTPQTQEWNATFSPDGRWIAYTSDESGQAEVYIAPFPNVSDSRVQVSTDGGTEPIWARHSPEIFYRDGTDSMVVANVTTKPTVGVTGRRVLFDASRYRATLFSRAYDVSPDGQRFVMIKTGGQGSTREVILVQNIVTELSRRVEDGRAGRSR